MASNPQLTAGQKYTLKWMGPYEFFSSHSNGDVTVLIGTGVNKQQVRLSSAGTIIKRTSASGAETKTFQPSLSEELSKAIKTPEKPKKSKPSEGYVVSYSMTPCQENPACCKPREVKHVAWDADQTIWNLPGTAAGVTGKLKKIDDDTVVEMGSPYSYGYDYSVTPYSRWNIEDYLSDTEKDLLVGLSADEKDFLLEEMAREHNELKKGKEKPKPAVKEEKETIRTTIKLLPTFRQTLDELDKRGISSSIISLNTPGSVKRILEEFGLAKRFVEIRDSYENKGRVFAQITKKIGVCPCDSIFVDDSRGNVQDVADKCGMGLQIGKGKDVEKPIDIMKFIKG